MRTLLFNVKNQTIRRESPYGFGQLVAGTNGYLKAKFTFSKDWDTCIKVVGFFTKDDIELPPRVLDNENSCCIPEEALKYHEFKITVYGKNDEYTITTRPITIKQYGGIQ